MSSSYDGLGASPSPSGTLTLAQREILITIRIVMAVLSLCGCFFVLGCMIKFKKLYGPHRLIMILTICNLGDAISSLLSFGTFSHESDRVGLCYFQGIAMQFFQVAAFCWSAVIAINLWFVVVRRKLDVDVLHKRYHIVAWVTVAICVFLPNVTRAYGPASVWCWISLKATWGNAWRFISFFVPFYISWLVIVVSYLWTYRIAKGQTGHVQENELEDTRRQIARLRWYPIIFIVLYIPATMNRVYGWVTGRDNFILFLLQVLTAPAVGLVNSIAYGFDTETRHTVANSLIRRGWCSYCVGDVLFEDVLPSRGLTSSSLAHPHLEMEEADIVDEVLDDSGSFPPLDAPIPLQPIHHDSDDDHVRVDF